MAEPSRALIALRSSNHRDRTERDRKTDRAYHLMRFFGTDETNPAPPFDATPRVRREIAQNAQLELTEQEKKLLATRGQRPGETREEYEKRRMIMRRALEKQSWR